MVYVINKNGKPLSDLYSVKALRGFPENILGSKADSYAKQDLAFFSAKFIKTETHFVVHESWLGENIEKQCVDYILHHLCFNTSEKVRIYLEEKIAAEKFLSKKELDIFLDGMTVLLKDYNIEHEYFVNGHRFVVENECFVKKTNRI